MPTIKCWAITVRKSNNIWFNWIEFVFANTRGQAIAMSELRMDGWPWTNIHAVREPRLDGKWYLDKADIEAAGYLVEEG